MKLLSWFRAGVKGKTSWEWMEILIVPFFFAVGAFYLESRVEQRQERIATERYEQEAAIAYARAKQQVLDDYLEKMQGLLLDRGLRTSSEDSEVRSVARAITTTALKELGGERNTLLIDFLQEADLIGVDVEDETQEEDIALLGGLKLAGVNLSNADLRGADLSSADLSSADLSNVDLYDTNLSHADLSSADLSNADMYDANLLDANLRGANLSDGDLRGAFLSSAILRDANLSSAILSGAILRGAFLSGANLRDANLRDANLSSAILRDARNLPEEKLEGSILCGTTLPERFTVDPDRDCEKL